MWMHSNRGSFRAGIFKLFPHLLGFSHHPQYSLDFCTNEQLDSKRRWVGASVLSQPQLRNPRTSLVIYSVDPGNRQIARPTQIQVSRFHLLLWKKHWHRETGGWRWLLLETIYQNIQNTSHPAGSVGSKEKKVNVIPTKKALLKQIQNLVLVL